MNASVYHDVGAANRTRTLFGQVMGYVAATTALFALGAYLGRNLGFGWAFVFYLLALACVVGMRFAVRSSARVSVALLFGMGLCLGLAISPTLVYYASADPQALWQAGGATALFIAGCGAAGYATRADLSGIARACYWALLGLIIFGIVLIFVQIPGGALIYSILGLVIFAGLTMFDFQRIRRINRPGLRIHDRRVDIPRRPQRVRALPTTIHQEPRLITNRCQRRRRPIGCGPHASECLPKLIDVGGVVQPPDFSPTKGRGDSVEPKEQNHDRERYRCDFR